jgi:hypothetical protein
MVIRPARALNGRRDRSYLRTPVIKLVSDGNYRCRRLATSALEGYQLHPALTQGRHDRRLLMTST